MLGTTTASVKSALQRARARCRNAAPDAEQIAEPTSRRPRLLLDRYIAAFENADAAELERLLVEDVTLEATPMRTWFAGRKTCVPFLRDHVLGAPGLAHVGHARQRPACRGRLHPGPAGEVPAIRDRGTHRHHRRHQPDLISSAIPAWSRPSGSCQPGQAVSACLTTGRSPVVPLVYVARHPVEQADGAVQVSGRGRGELAGRSARRRSMPGDSVSAPAWEQITAASRTAAGSTLQMTSRRRPASGSGLVARELPGRQEGGMVRARADQEPFPAKRRVWGQADSQRRGAGPGRLAEVREHDGGPGGASQLLPPVFGATVEPLLLESGEQRWLLGPRAAFVLDGVSQGQQRRLAEFLGHDAGMTAAQAREDGHVASRGPGGGLADRGLQARTGSPLSHRICSMSVVSASS